MQGGFQKFRKQRDAFTLIGAALFGLSAALFAIGLLLLIAKFNTKPLHWALYVFIPFAVCAAVSNAYYLLTRFSDLKLAKQIDEQFGLNEKVQTMVEFKDEQTDMVCLQRADAQARLETLSANELKWKNWWLCLVAGVCAIALFVTGLALPQKKVVDNTPTPPPKIEFSITLTQKTALATLIKNVKESKAEGEIKTTLLAQLETFQAGLDEIETENELYEQIVEIIETVDEFVETHNTYKRVYKPIRASESEAVQKFAIGIGLNALPESFIEIKTFFENEEKYNVTTLIAIDAFTTELETRFKQVDERAEDKLMIALSALIEDFKAVAALDPTVWTYERVLEQTDTAFNNNVTALAKALTQQTDNRTVTSDVIKNLISIFNLPQELIPNWGGEPLEGLSATDQPPDEQTKPGDGIIIDGVLYPSDETVYDYFTKVICAYGEVFEGDAHNYKAAINQLLAEGVANGTVSPEVEEMIRVYLERLSGSDAPATGGSN